MIPVLIALDIASVIFVACFVSYHLGREDGYDKGREAGLKIGRLEGRRYAEHIKITTKPNA